MARLGANSKPVREYDFNGWLEDVNNQPVVGESSSSEDGERRHQSKTKSLPGLKNAKRSIARLSRSNLKLLCEKLTNERLDTLTTSDDPTGGIDNTPPAVLKKSVKRMNKLVKYQREMESRGNGVITSINTILSDLEEQSLNIDTKLEAIRMAEEISLCKDTETDGLYGGNSLIEKSREDLPRPEDNPEELSDSSEEAEWHHQSCEDARDALAMPVSDLIYLIKAMRIQHSINPSLTAYYEPPGKKVFLDKEALKREVIVLRNKHQQLVASNQIIKDALLASHHLSQRVACWVQRRMARLRVIEEEKAAMQESLEGRIAVLEGKLTECEDAKEELEWQLCQQKVLEQKREEESQKMIDSLKQKYADEKAKCKEVEDDLSQVLKKLEEVKEQPSGMSKTNRSKDQEQRKVSHDVSSLAKEIVERKRLASELETARERIGNLEREISERDQKSALVDRFVSDINERGGARLLFEGKKKRRSHADSISSNRTTNQTKTSLQHHIARYESLLMFVEDGNSGGYLFNDSAVADQMQMMQFNATIPELQGNDVLDYIASLFHSAASDGLKNFRKLTTSLHNAASGVVTNDIDSGSGFKNSLKSYRSLFATAASEFARELHNSVSTLGETVLDQVGVLLEDIATLRVKMKSPSTVDSLTQTDFVEVSSEPIVSFNSSTQTDNLEFPTASSSSLEQDCEIKVPQEQTPNPATTSLAFFLSSTENMVSDIISDVLAVQRFFGETIRYGGPLLSSFHVNDDIPHEPTDLDTSEYVLRACLASCHEMVKVAKKTPGSLLFPQFMTVAQKLKAVRAGGHKQEVAEDAFMARQRDAANRRAERQEAMREEMHNVREATFASCVLAEENESAMAGAVQRWQQEQRAAYKLQQEQLQQDNQNQHQIQVGQQHPQGQQQSQLLQVGQHQQEPVQLGVLLSNAKKKVQRQAPIVPQKQASGEMEEVRKLHQLLRRIPSGEMSPKAGVMGAVHKLKRSISNVNMTRREEAVPHSSERLFPQI